MKRFYMRDAHNAHTMTIYSKNATRAAVAFYDRYGYFPYIIKEIDAGGATIRTIKEP